MDLTTLIGLGAGFTFACLLGVNKKSLGVYAVAQLIALGLFLVYKFLVE